MRFHADLPVALLAGAVGVSRTLPVTKVTRSSAASDWLWEGVSQERKQNDKEEAEGWGREGSRQKRDGDLEMM